MAEGDEVWMRFSSSGTHQAGLCGLPPAGKRVGAHVAAIMRFAGGNSPKRTRRSTAQSTELTARNPLPATPSASHFYSSFTSNTPACYRWTDRRSASKNPIKHPQRKRGQVDQRSTAGERQI